MKNKKGILIFLSLLIIILIGITIFYTMNNKDKIFNRNDVSSSEGSNKEDIIEKNILEANEMRLVTSYEEISKLIARDEITYLVLGRTGCGFCTKYKPVLEKVVENYHIEINYVDLGEFSKEDYKTFMNSDLTILGKCTDSGNDIPISQGFGTPLTLFVSSNKTVDCIRSYKSYDDLEVLLLKKGYIK